MAILNYGSYYSYRNKTKNEDVKAGNGDTRVNDTFDRNNKEGSEKNNRPKAFDRLKEDWHKKK